MHQIFRKSEVLSLTGLSNSTLYRYIQSGDFPPPIKLGVRRVGWSEADLNDWLESRKAKGPLSANGQSGAV